MTQEQLDYITREMNHCYANATGHFISPSIDIENMNTGPFKFEKHTGVKGIVIFCQNFPLTSRDVDPSDLADICRKICHAKVFSDVFTTELNGHYLFQDQKGGMIYYNSEKKATILKDPK